MIKEKYEKPIMEVVNLIDDVILTSGASNSCYPADGCSTDAICATYCPSYLVYITPEGFHDMCTH